MSTSNPILERFWRSMGERFGKRWLDEYGPQPTRAWAELLEPWTADTIRQALDAMGEKAWQHPPTLPQFQALIRDVDRREAAKGATDWIRGHWRTVVVTEGATAAGLSLAQFEPWLLARPVLLDALRELLDYAANRERATSARSEALTREVIRRAREAVHRELSSSGEAA